MWFTRLPRSGCCWLLGGVLILRVAGAAEPLRPLGVSVWLIEENDEIGGTDRYYTQGARLTVLLREGDLPAGCAEVLGALPAWGFADHLPRLGFALGQTLHTPADLLVADPPLDDRPYAGWLYGVVNFQRRGVTRAGTPLLESWQLELGVLGPAALGEDSQRFAHSVLFSGKEPNGWDTQLGNEPGFNLKYARAARFVLAESDRLRAEVIPAAGASLGTIDTSFRAGAQVRAGWNLPGDFGPQRIDALSLGSHGRVRDGRREFFGYGFCGVEGRAVARNAFLDGNLSRTSRSVDKETLVGECSVGAVVGRGGVEGGFAYVWRTREFKSQPESHAYGAVFVRANF
jgi:lipid A 3-O-deacylase